MRALVIKFIPWEERVSPAPTCRVYHNSYTRTGEPIVAWVDAALVAQLQLLKAGATTLPGLPSCAV